MAIKIRKAKIARGGAIEASYVDDDGNEIIIKGSNVCHEDCKAAFVGLIPFLADLTEQREAVGIDWDDLGGEANKTLLSSLDVTAFSLTDDVANPMVTLTGKRILKTSKVLSICAPATALTSETETYDRCDELDEAIQRAVYEVEAYITERKWRVRQKELDFCSSEDPFADAQAADDAPPISEEAGYEAMPA